MTEVSSTRLYLGNLPRNGTQALTVLFLLQLYLPYFCSFLSLFTLDSSLSSTHRASRERELVHVLGIVLSIFIIILSWIANWLAFSHLLLESLRKRISLKHNQSPPENESNLDVSGSAGLLIWS